MRPLKFIITTISLLTIAISAQAQMELSDLTNGGKQRKPERFADSIRHQTLSKVEYFSPAGYRYEREQIRKERNDLQISGAVQGSLTNLNEAWIETSGGDNTVTLMASLTIKHIFTKNLFSLQTNMSANFGYYRMMLERTLDSGDIEQYPVWYKNQDEFQMEVTPSLKMSNNWSYGVSVKFRSQFTSGYVSSASQESYNLKSDFMSPGYLDISGGFIYKCPSTKLPITLTLSPLAMSAVYVSNSSIRENAQYTYLDPSVTAETYVKPYGVDPYSSSKYEGGSSVQVNFSRTFGKSQYLTYTTTLFSFYGWMSQITHGNVYSNVDDFDNAMTEWEASDYDSIEPMLSIHPTLRWENKIEIKASKLLSTTLNFQLYYNRAQNVKIQTQTLLSVGLSYTFSNRS